MHLILSWNPPERLNSLKWPTASASSGMSSRLMLMFWNSTLSLEGVYRPCWCCDKTRSVTLTQPLCNMKTRLWFIYFLLSFLFPTSTWLFMLICVILTKKNNLAPWKTSLFFAVHLTLSLSVCPSVLLPTHERLAWPPPVPSRHQLIYQNTWTDPLVSSAGFVKCSSRSQFLAHS